jgi:hypothetical protein
MPSATAAACGEIRPESMYTLEEIKSRLGIGAGSLRAMRRQGLTVRYQGRIGLIFGRDLIAHIESSGKTER